MRSNREATSQTTCDADDCPAYAITGHYQRTSVEEQAYRHNRAIAADGWVDHEGRDYCPDHTPTTTHANQ